MLKKIIIFVSLFAIILFFTVTKETPIKILWPEAQKISILAFGDMMLDRNVYLKVQKANDFNFPFSKIDSLLQSADLRIANLEGPITDFNSVSVGNTRMRFTNSPQFLPALKSRFDVLSLANNHILDFDDAGYVQTQNFLDGAGIKYFGDYKNREENLSVIIEKEGIRIGFVGYHALAEKNLEIIVEKIKNLKPQVDFLIVFAHWGGEYKNIPSVSQKDEAMLFVDAGADLILGSHPHVVQTIEKYKGKKIFYSLGNFIFDQYFSEDTMKGLGVKINLEKSDNKISVEYTEIPIFINQDSQPQL